MSYSNHMVYHVLIGAAILLYYIVFNCCNFFAYVIFMSIHVLRTGQKLQVLEFQVLFDLF